VTRDGVAGRGGGVCGNYCFQSHLEEKSLSALAERDVTAMPDALLDFVMCRYEQ